MPSLTPECPRASNETPPAFILWQSPFDINCKCSFHFVDLVWVRAIMYVDEHTCTHSEKKEEKEGPLSLIELRQSEVNHLAGLLLLPLKKKSSSETFFSLPPPPCITCSSSWKREKSGDPRTQPVHIGATMTSVSLIATEVTNRGPCIKYSLLFIVATV